MTILEVGMTGKRTDYKRLKGVVVATITPYDERYNVNYSSLRRLCSFLAGKGVDGLFVCGATGPGGVFPEVYVRLYDRFFARDYEGALVYQKSATAISKLMADGSHLDLIKKALRLRGIDVGSVRPPLRALSEEEELTYLKAVTELARECKIEL